jgi:hypothetical protein
MEHRCNMRRAVSLDANIQCRGSGLLVGRIRNIGLGGLFVETGWRRPALNTIVELSFNIPLNGELYPCRLRALVVHRSECGAGLMFEELGPQLRSLLSRIVEHELVPSRYSLPVYAGRSAVAG